MVVVGLEGNLAHTLRADFPKRDIRKALERGRTGYLVALSELDREWTLVGELEATS